MFKDQSTGVITVLNPTKNFDPSNPLTPYVAYAIKTAAFPSVIVSRRYSDFDWLSDKLVELYPGVIIPPLPEKQVIGRFDDDFIEYRKRALEKFLNRVSKHEKLSVSPFFETFLMASHESFQRARMNHQSVYMTTAISAASWLGNTFSSIATKKGVEFEKSAVDMQMDDITEKVDKLTELMSNVRDQAYEFIKASCESSLSLTELSDCFQLLGEAEHPYDPIVASLYSNTGVFINAVGTEVGKQAHASIVSFEEAILEQLNLLRSVKRALSLREAARGHHIQCKNETLNCEAAHARVLGVEGKRDQVIPCKAAFENAQRAERDAKNRLEIITEDFLADYVRFKAEKAVDLRSILVKFAHLQVLLSERVERLALGTVPKLTEKTPQPPLPAPPATEGKGPKQQRSTGATTHDGRHEAQAATDGKPELSDKELKENLSEKVEKLSMNAVPESVKETSQTKVPVPLAPEGKESSQSSSAAASSNDARVKEVPIINEKSDIYKDKIEEKEKVQSELPEATPSSISTLSTTKKEEEAGNATAVLETGVPESLETPTDTNTPCEDPVAEDDSKVA